jgi:hypothetical protein
MLPALTVRYDQLPFDAPCSNCKIWSAGSAAI